MLGKAGLAISYFVAIVYVLSILFAADYCIRHGCKGPDLDVFMPAFALTPFGAIGCAFCLRDSIRRIKARGRSSGLFWPLAFVFAAVLLCVISLIVWMIYETAFNRGHLTYGTPARTSEPASQH
jgi:hypothetical protein